MSVPQRFMIAVLVVLVVGFVVLKLLSFTGSAPVREKTMTALPMCPPSPNCVCSVDVGEAHSIAPLKFDQEPAVAWRTLHEVVSRLGGKLVAGNEGAYARYEFRSQIFGYIDDMECLLNADKMRIDIRSASRSGHSDFGVNRKRVELIRSDFEKQQSASVKSPE